MCLQGVIQSQFDQLDMWNDKETDLDLLGHSRIAQTIISIMDEQELCPLTIGVYGSWGIGKSSVLSLINQELKNDSNTLTLVFNGWLFQGYEDSRSALMESVVSALMQAQPKNKQLLKVGKSLLKRINWLKVAKTAGSLAMTAATGVPSAALLGVPAMLTQAKEFFSSEDKEAGSTSVKVEVEGEEEPYLKEIEETVPGQIHAFREELRELIESSKISRLVVLVDELDRCLPAAVIDILEAIRLFLFVEGTVFILAADEQMIEYAVRRHFPDLPVAQSEYIKHYLEKLVQVPIRVPSLNQLQTKNYVRFLLLQYELKHDKVKLKNISEAFEASKTNPYENIDISYDFITKQLGEGNEKLKAALVVAEQLGAVLAKELRGNPRNIKRFLNTIFFRLRVANIYKINDKVHLDILSKLMLLERFHPKEFEKIVEEAHRSQQGRADFIIELEKKAKTDKQLKNVQKSALTEDDLLIWAKMGPSLKDVDLKPYLFVSSEKAVVFDSYDTIPEVLKPLISALSTGNKMAIASLEKDIKALSPDQLEVINENLYKNAEGISDWNTIPSPLTGALALINYFPFLGEKFVSLIDGIPSKNIKPWMLANLAGVKTDAAIKAKNALFQKIVNSSESPRNIKVLAESLLNQ